MLIDAYVQAAARTASPNFYRHLLPNTVTPMECVGLVETMGLFIDPIKKTLFYGKPWVDEDTVTAKADEVMEAAINAKQLPIDTMHALFGIATELSELTTACRGGDKVKITDELGDMFWYIAMLTREYGIDWVQAMEANIAKLQARFPDKFSDTLAINRDERVEMNALEASLASS